MAPWRNPLRRFSRRSTAPARDLVIRFAGNLYSAVAMELTHFQNIVLSIGSDLVYAGACYFSQ